MTRPDYHNRHSGLSRWDWLCTGAFFVTIGTILALVLGQALAAYLAQWFPLLGCRK